MICSRSWFRLGSPDSQARSLSTPCTASGSMDIYTMEYYSAIKKNEIMPFAATWMDLEIIILSEISQKEKDIS